MGLERGRTAREALEKMVELLHTYGQWGSGVPTENWNTGAYNNSYIIADKDETVCLLSKLKSDHHIEVDLSLDELDLTAAESKATYEEIKEYVLKNSGYKVSSLYIAQVKEKMGIKERENFNVSKKDDAKVPQCPADKEKAVVEALKHFKMIG